MSALKAREATLTSDQPWSKNHRKFCSYCAKKGHYAHVSEARWLFVCFVWTCVKRACELAMCSCNVLWVIDREFAM